MAFSPLLALPFEIRRKIYQYVFADSLVTFKIFEIDKRLFSWFRKDPLHRWIVTTPPPDRLLDICHQVRDEALPELRANLRVSCDITEKAASTVNTVMPLRAVLRDCICFLHLIAHTEYTFWPQNAMPSLQQVLVESKYNVRIVLRQSEEGFVDRSTSALIDAVKSWHLDLLNEPEIPDGPGSWGLLKAILHPKRHFALQWKGRISVFCVDEYTPLSRVKTLADELDLHFDWDTKSVVAGQEQIQKLAAMDTHG